VHHIFQTFSSVVHHQEIKDKLKFLNAPWIITSVGTVVSGATLASAGALPSSVLGLVAQAPMAAPGRRRRHSSRGLLDSGGGEEVVNVEVIW